MRDHARMRRTSNIAAVVALLLCCLGAVALSSCGGGGGSTSITILIIPRTITSIDAGSTQTLDFTAVLDGDTSGSGVTWCLPGNKTTKACPGTNTACASIGTAAGNCGTLTAATPTSVSYNPPEPTSAGISVTLVAVSVADQKTSKSVTITVALAPKFTTTVLQNGINGTSYTQTITISGGVSPYTYSLDSPNTLPQCVSLNVTSTSTTTTISGRPCDFGTFSFTVDVVDSGGSAVIKQPYTITIAQPPALSVATASLPQGFASLPYNASVVPQGGVGPYTWTLVPGMGVLPPNLGLSSTTGLISGTATTAGTYQFQVTITDSSLLPPDSHHQTATATLSITIQTIQPLSIVPGTVLGDGAVATPYLSAPLQATGGVPPYTWTLVQGTLPAGLLLSTTSGGNGSISGVPVLAGTSSFFVQVSDSENPPQVARSSSSPPLSINILPGTANSNALFQGPYAFLFNGFDQNGSVIIVGTLSADGSGNITAGEEDSNRVSTNANVSGVVNGVALAGTYSIGKDGRGTMQLKATAPPGGQNVTTDYDLVLDSNGNIHFFEDNSNAATETNPPGDQLATHGAGILKPVVGSSFSSSSLSGNYVFEVSGPDTSDASGKPEALAGRVNADGSSSLTAGMSDLNDAGTFSSQTISGHYVIASGNRGLITMTFAPGNQPQITLEFVFYFVSSSDLFVMEVDTTSTTFKNPPRLSGEMLLQQPTVQFGQASLNGASVATGTGLDGTNASVLAGLLSATLCDGASPASFSYDQNDGGTISQLSFNGTCTIASNGRAVFQNLGSSAATTRMATAYLSAPGQGFLIGSDAAVTTGLLEKQVGSSFSDSSVAGSYALSGSVPATNQTTNVLGQIVGNVDGSGNGNGALSGVTDEVDPPAAGQEAGTVRLNQPFTGSTINTLAANGRGTLTITPTAGFPTNAILYVVSPGSFRLISNDPGSPLPPQVIFLDH